MAYAAVEELAGLLRIQSPTVMQTAAMERCLEAAATEIDWELGYTALTPAPDPPPPLVVEVNLERAVEHWRQSYSPFGVVGVGAESEPIVAARNTWYRHQPETASPFENTPALHDPRRNHGGHRRRPGTRRGRGRRAPGVPVPELEPDPAGAGHLPRRAVPDRGRVRGRPVPGLVHDPGPGHRQPTRNQPCGCCCG